MRPIKFRAWDKGKGEMCWVDEWNPTNGIVRATRKHAKPYCLPFDSNHAELMQFTGLTDKNGKEIYEGDIVRETKGDGLVGTVIWQSEWGAWFAEWTNVTSQVLGQILPVEIIGNVHSNPELLK